MEDKDVKNVAHTASISRKYAKNHLKKDNGVIFLHINHDLNDIIEFHEMLSGFFCESLFIVIPYNLAFPGSAVCRKSNFFGAYKDADKISVYRGGEPISETGSDMHTQMRDLFIAAVKQIYDRIPEKKILIMEDGGYHYSIMEEIKERYPLLKASILGCVEQTRNGIRAYCSHAKKSRMSYPVLTVARSKIKMSVESYYIAKSAVDLTTEFLSLIGEQISKKNMIVIGYGAIGRSISNILESAGYRHKIVEEDEFIISAATAEGKVCVSCIDRNHFEEETVIIGTTGNAGFTKEMLTAFLNSDSSVLTLVSISSKQSEFVQFYEYLNECEHESENIYGEGRYLGKKFTITTDSGKKYVRVFGDGYPINFFCTWENGLPEQVIDMIYAEMIFCVDTLMENRSKLNNTLYVMGDGSKVFGKVEENILKDWESNNKIVRNKSQKDWKLTHPCEAYLRNRI